MVVLFTWDCAPLRSSFRNIKTTSFIKYRWTVEQEFRAILKFFPVLYFYLRLLHEFSSTHARLFAATSV